jgi:hypothetical protein
MRDVVERVRKGQPPVAKLADMVPVMRLVDSAYSKAAPLSRTAATP